MFFSRNTDDHVAQYIGQAFGFKVGADLGKYIGVPIIHGRTTRRTYSYLVDKCHKRSTSYHSTHLSLVGRTTLAKSVLNALPVYTMQTTVLPQATCANLDALCQGFIWRSNGEQRRLHLVNWNMVCKPKEYGGLGIRKSTWVNEAFMMKMAWGLLANTEDLWVKIIRGKYMPYDTCHTDQGKGQKSRL